MPVLSFQVTDLKPALRSENRVNVFINGRFDFSLDLSQVVDYHVKLGATFTAEEISELRSASEFSKLYASTLEWIFARPRSVKETRDHLNQRKHRRTLENRSRALARERQSESLSESYSRGSFKKSKTSPLPEISSENIEKVISRLLEKGYLDDEKFARFFAENRNQKKGTSLRRLEQELYKKGVPKDIIEHTLSSSSRDESEEILKIIQKKRARYSDEKLLAYLMRQGFSYQIASDTIRCISHSETD